MVSTVTLWPVVAWEPVIFVKITMLYCNWDIYLINVLVCNAKDCGEKET